MSKLCLMALAIVFAWPARGATLHVPSAHATIASAHTAAAAGDTIVVNAASYTGAERVAWTKDGTAGNYISVVSSNGQALVRGFDLTTVSYVRIIGFEITHNSSTYSRAITMGGTCDHIELLNNYIHNTYGDQCIQGNAGAAVSFVTIRGNYINEVRWVTGVETNCERQCIGSDNVSHHWLVEYNIIARSGDFVNLYGTNHIVRNNYLHDFRNSYCPVPPASHASGEHTHSDMFQPGSDGLNANAKNHNYERNFMGDSIEKDSHVALFQDNQHATTGTDTNLMMRGNVAFNIGDGFCGGYGSDGIRVYNNSIYQMGRAKVGSVLYFNNTTSGSLDVLFANNIIQDDGIITDALDVISPGTWIQATNIGYQAGSETSYISTADPLFIDPLNRVFRLQAGSAAIGNGKRDIITITSANSSGTSFDVNNGALLSDGWGMAEGDIITTGGTTTRITVIVGNTVTVAASVMWTNGQPVYWGTDTDPEIGAFPYGSVELTSATYSAGGGTATVATTGDARKVWKYRNGVPVAEDYDAPFTFTDHRSGDTYKVGALYAQAVPVVTAVEEGGGEPVSGEPAKKRAAMKVRTR